MDFISSDIISFGKPVSITLDFEIYHSTPSKLSISSSILFTVLSLKFLSTNAICIDTILNFSDNSLLAGTLANLSGKDLFKL